MIFWGMIAPDVGLDTASYTKAMLATIGLWLVVFPVARKGGKGGRKDFNLMGKMGKDWKREFKTNSGKRSGPTQQTLTEDEINITSSFSGTSSRVTSQNFRGGTVNTNFGGVQLDLTGAALADNEANLEVKAFVGGVEITVPEGWDVQAGITATFGGISDERNHAGSHSEGAPRLTITGTATAGGIKIKD